MVGCKSSAAVVCFIYERSLYAANLFYSKNFHKVLHDYSKDADVGNIIVLGMKEALKTAQRNKEIDIGETILYTAGEIAR